MDEPMIVEGDCIEVMKELDENTFDAIVTDPPYNLHFMGKDWDKDLLHEKWLKEAYRILKPGASILVMGGTRTFHRLMVAIEDSGFVIKDTLMWMYGSGFPKCQDLGKRIDKQGGKDISWFIDYVIKIAEERGVSKKELTNLFLSKNGKPTGWLYNKASHKQGLTVEQFNKIKDFLQFPFSSLEEAKREIIGKEEHWGQAGNSLGIYGQEWDLSVSSTDLAKHWDGFKLGGIKPAYEPIVWAVKPPEGSYTDNVLKWGVGAVNVDECRVETNEQNEKREHKGVVYEGVAEGYKRPNKSSYTHKTDWKMQPKGRFPANVILSHHSECVQVGTKRVKGSHQGLKKGSKQNKGGSFGGGLHEENRADYVEKNGLETVENWDCHPDCPIRMLDEQSGQSKSVGGKGNKSGKVGQSTYGDYSGKEVGEHAGGLQDSGGASRFFYCAKASRGERNLGLKGMEEKDACHYNQSGRRYGGGNRENWKDPYKKPKFPNTHPTVKPIKLFEYLIKLVTRTGQIIFDPFLGSGTTMIAANNVNRDCVGVEKEKEYIPIAKKRVEYWLKEKEKQNGICT